MDLNEICERTKLPIRLLRYVIDHRIVPVPRLRRAKGEWGRPRRFADDAGVGIACAAWLLQDGLKRTSVAKLIDGLPRIRFEPGNPASGMVISRVLSTQLPAVVEFGDGENLRYFVDGRDYGWRQPGPDALMSDSYKPKVIIRLDLGAIRDLVLGHTKESIDSGQETG